MLFKLIIFDFDGPILNSWDRSKNSVLAGIKELIKSGTAPSKTKITEETFIKHWGYPGLKTAQMMFPNLTEKELVIIGHRWKNDELKKRIPLVKGALKTIKWLKRKKYLTSLLTSRSDNLKFHLENHNPENLFDLIQSWEDPKLKLKKIHKNHIFLKRHKPDPLALIPTINWAKRKGVAKNEILLIDDALVGLETAQNSNVSFVGVCTGPINSKKKWEKYGKLKKKYVIKSIAELPEWLKDFNAAQKEYCGSRARACSSGVRTPLL